MRSDTQTINGLLAYQLGTTQTINPGLISTPAVSVSLSDTKRPTSDVSRGFPNIYPVTPNTHYDKVDEAVADDTATYIETGNTTTRVYDRYGKATYTLPAGQKVAFVKITCRGMTEQFAAGKEAIFYFGVYIGTTYYLSGAQKTNYAWSTKTFTYALNPATSLEWTEADINNMQIAVAGQSYYVAADLEYYYAYVTQVYVEVYTYVDATVYYSISVWKRDSAGTETVIESNIASYSILLSALRIAEGIKTATGDISPAVNLVSTDAIVVRMYQKVGAGTWTLVDAWITEQLGAQSLDAVTWTVDYYLSTQVDTSYVYGTILHGTASYNSRIENFTWTSAPAVGVASKRLLVGVGL